MALSRWHATITAKPLITILLGAVSLLAQTNHSNTALPTERRDSAVAQAADAKQRGTEQGPLAGLPQILSDTMGVDFAPYMWNLIRSVRWNWNQLIPDEARPPIMKQGKVAIEFAILKDGTIAPGMELVGSSGDVALDRAAWASIVNSNPFALLPKEFTGESLVLRFYFYYNMEADMTGFCISPVEATVAIGSSLLFRALENYKETTVTWSILGCDSDCGTISVTGLYTAPPKIPSLSNVKINAERNSSPRYSVGATVKVVASKP